MQALPTDRSPAARRPLLIDGADAFIALVDRHIARSRRQNAAFAVLCLAAEPMAVPDGDVVVQRLLGECEKRLCSRVRATDQVLRYGPREFGVLLLGANAAAAWAVSLRLMRAGGGTYRLGDELLELHLRVGHAAFPAAGENGAALVHAASATTVPMPAVRVRANDGPALFSPAG